MLPAPPDYDRGMTDSREPRPVAEVRDQEPPAAGVRGQRKPRGRGHDLMLILQNFTIESSRYADTARKAYGLAHSDVNALTEVMQGQRRGAPLRAGDVARRLVISASAATAVIDRLANRGHLERQSDTGDRREVLLGATPSAAATGRAMFTPMVDELLREFESWDDAELDVLRRRIPELTAAIQRAQRVTPPAPDLGDGAT